MDNSFLKQELNNAVCNSISRSTQQPSSTIFYWSKAPVIVHIVDQILKVVSILNIIKSNDVISHAEIDLHRIFHHGEWKPQTSTPAIIYLFHIELHLIAGVHLNRNHLSLVQLGESGGTTGKNISANHQLITNLAVMSLSFFIQNLDETIFLKVEASIGYEANQIQQFNHFFYFLSILFVACPFGQV